MANDSDDVEKAKQAAEAIDEIGVERLTELVVEAFREHGNRFDLEDDSETVTADENADSDFGFDSNSAE